MDRVFLAHANIHYQRLTRCQALSTFRKFYSSEFAYARGLKSISCMRSRASIAHKERSHKDAVALHREIKAFRALLLRRSHVNGAIPSGGLLNTGVRQYSTSSEGNDEKGDKDGKKPSANDLIYYIFVLLGLVGIRLIFGILELLKFDNTCNSAFPIVLLFGATCMLLDWHQSNIFVLLGLVGFSLILGILEFLKYDIVSISWQDFVNDLLLQGKVKEALVTEIPEGDGREEVTIKLHRGVTVNGQMIPLAKVVVVETPSVGYFDNKLRALEDELGIPESERLPVEHVRRQRTDTPLSRIFFFNNLLVLIALISFGYTMKKHGMVSFGVRNQMDSSVPKPMKVDSLKGITFKDVAGLKEAKQEVIEFVDYIKAPQRFKELGAKTPRGALLLGPPGCGKTLLAKALAAESDVPFFNSAGSEFVEMIGGLGARRVRNLFKEARQKTPCIIYIDEIDAIGRKRSEGVYESNDESEQTLNQLLAEMDGMGTVDGLIVFAATNRVDILDSALLRPGRFDRLITIDPPTLAERIELFDMYLGKIKLDKPPSTYSQRLAHLTPGMSGADINNICNEAAINAARETRKSVLGSDLDASIERVQAGAEKKTGLLAKPEKKIIAYHESGHVLTSWMLEHTDALMKVTIVPRTRGMLGFAQYAPSENKLYSQEQLFETMCVALGGRAAEAITFNSITTGAQSDLQVVTKMAYNQIKRYGMSKSLGHLSFPQQAGDNDMFMKKPFSKKLSRLMDEEVRDLIARAYRHTETVLTENKDKLKLLAQSLLDKETLSYTDVEALIGPPPFGKKKVVDYYPHFEGHIPKNGENGANGESGPQTGGSDTKENTDKFFRLEPGWLGTNIVYK